MLPEQYRWIAEQFEPEGDLWLLLDVARTLEAEGNLAGAAIVLDRAYGIDPTATELRLRRQTVLDRLAVVEHGLTFRYVPGGPFLMGHNEGDSDERPRRPVWLAPYWISETPISWAAYCRLLNWTWPPSRTSTPHPQTQLSDQALFYLHAENKIRLQYCEDHTTRAIGWHRHIPEYERGSPPRTDPAAPWSYDAKPMVAVSWQSALDLAGHLSTASVSYGLPTEAQWEKAARGGLIGARHAWGDEPPSPENCDFARFQEYSLLPMTTFAPNGYGLHAMNGCVWEWTNDWYDSEYYRLAPDSDPTGPPTGEQKVLRGGSWTDCAEVVTVTFRMSHGSRSFRDEDWGNHLSPNVGFRLCRMVRG